ncbi:Isoleucyl-tRNA synthetase [Prevotella communis]|uniref:Isoleucine--tRNA ligase n=1 Tax=Prevotella communis TaxID=2913614 RepID=A0A1G7UL47_9BACT|nr:isoleucine--tRNA ligase [Prevotella communis]UKK68456.1 isoleucine--tRNA ligase [Prevotella communis]UKK69409.1 isoleucine--tRNA ligase [Prevotella communis]SDG48217.1 Isoleucyl-tRNA synthetase [Prevotella communis]
MAKRFAEHNGLNLTQVNNEILEKWMKDDIFHRSIDEREGCPQFVFFEGPPSANGHPGIHHVLGRSLKDTFNRYKTMQGFQVKRKAGWDTHGLPVELGVEKELGITKADIDNKESDKYISTEDYNKKCRENVMKFTAEWRELTERMGYFVDLDNPYITYDNKYIETLWYLLKKFYEKGLLYKGYTIQPYSPAAGTGLSSHELNQPGCYRDVKDTTCTALFKMKNPKAEMTEWGKPYFMAWTTTPWTLAANSALCVGPKIDYVALQTYNPYTAEKITVVMAEARVAAYFDTAAEITDGGEMPEFKKGEKFLPYRVVGRYKGTDLVGMEYEQLLPMIKPMGDAFKVIPGDYVTTEDGAGIVHIAPNFGADDAFVAKKAGICPIVLIDKKGNERPVVDLQGKYFVLEDLDAEFVNKYVDVEKWGKYAGRYVKNAYDENLTDKDETLDISICMDLKAEGKAFKIEKHVHNYPHCWRTDKPVLYYPLDSWFIKSSACKERMSQLNTTIGWHPESTGTGRFGNWLENLNDWNLSRSRFWGTPLPIWRSEDGEEKCIGSLEELYNEIEKAVAAGVMTSNPLKEKGFVPGDMSKENYDKIDMHRPYVDYIVLVSDSGKPMKRESDLIDVWFDSGSMPYAQIHYPFENRELIDNNKAFPADFINEGVDQTRGWFFTLHAIATMIFDSVAFKNVISTGLVLDAKGNKMSKHVGNVINPFEMIDKYGSDAVRFYMITNSEPWDNLKFDPEGVAEISRKFFGTLYNTYSLFAMYANVDNFDPKAPQIPVEKRPEFDRWILSCLNSLVKGVEEEMNGFDPTRAGRLIDKFVDEDLSNWYVRLNKKRFWGKEMDEDKLAAYQTLYECLMTVSKLLAPFAPFFADRIYCDMGGEMDSVHLEKFPVANMSLVNADLEQRMEIAQRITTVVLSLRKKEGIAVKQPLQTLMIPPVDEAQRIAIESVKQIFLQEVNVKDVKFVEGQGILVKKVKCNFRTMGKKFGKDMKAVAAAVTDMTQEQIAELETNGKVQLGSYEILAEDVEVISEDIPGWLVGNDGNLTIALDITLTDELRAEGMARTLVNRIQNIRKKSGLEITDRIRVQIEPNAAVMKAVEDFGDYIARQVLADEVKLEANEGQSVEFDDFKLNINITKS